MKYQILQMDLTPENHFYIYSGLDMLERHNLKPEINRYKIVYTGEVDIKNDIVDILEILFEKFNINHPLDFHGHSLSVSDIVFINGEYWYCDSIGWKKLNK